MSKRRRALETRVYAAALAALLTGLSHTARALPSLNTYAEALGEVFQGNASKAYAHQYMTDSGTGSAATSAGIDTTLTQDVYIPATGDSEQLIWEVRASGSATASASYGSLHARSTAEFQLVPGSYTFQGVNSSGSPYSFTYVTPLNKPQGSGYAAASFEDSFFLSTSVSGATTVSVRFTMTLDAAILGYSVEGSGWGRSNAGGQLSLSTTSRFSFGDEILSTYIDNTTPASQTVSFTEDLRVGQYYYIQDALDVRAEVPTDDCTPPTCNQQSFLANASDTQSLNIDVLSPDATLHAGSGHDYSTVRSVAVSEPASISMFGFGLALLGFSRRRRPRG